MQISELSDEALKMALLYGDKDHSGYKLLEDELDRRFEAGRKAREAMDKLNDFIASMAQCSWMDLKAIKDMVNEYESGLKGGA